MKLTLRSATLAVCLGLLMALPTHARAKSKGSGYAQTNLISDIPGLAEFTDPTLLNPWGLAFFPGASPFWINENISGFSALDFSDGVAFPALPRVIIPPPPPRTSTGTPTGIVANFFVA